MNLAPSRSRCLLIQFTHCTSPKKVLSHLHRCTPGVRHSLTYTQRCVITCGSTPTDSCPDVILSHTTQNHHWIQDLFSASVTEGGRERGSHQRPVLHSTTDDVRMQCAANQNYLSSSLGKKSTKSLQLTVTKPSPSLTHTLAAAHFLLPTAKLSPFLLIYIAKQQRKKTNCKGNVLRCLSTWPRLWSPF